MADERDLQMLKVEQAVYARLWVMVERIAEEHDLTTETAQDIVWEQAEIVAHEDAAPDAA